MPKVAPHLRSFNAGVFSALVEGRVDLDRYPASMRDMRNFVAAPQGPAIRRSGTQFSATAYNDTDTAAFVPFIFAEDEAYVLEFTSSGRILFHTEVGVQTYAAVDCTVASTTTIDSATLGAEVGDQVALSGLPDSLSLNGVVFNITAKVGDVYTIDGSIPAGSYGTIQAYRVYHVEHPLTAEQLVSLRTLQDQDRVLIFRGTKAVLQLSRYDTYDWRLADFVFKDGPYLPIIEDGTRITPSDTGNPIPAQTTASASVTSSGDAASCEAWKAFDVSEDTYWQSSANQTGWIAFEFASAKVITGYVIYAARTNADTSYTTRDYAPGDWTFEGWDGSAWVVLHTVDAYVLYDGLRSAHFNFPNETAYTKYRLNITSTTRNGPLPPRIRRLVMTEDNPAAITLTASGTTGVNRDQGFKATDVGRLIRMKGRDNAWRALRITAWTSETVVSAVLESDPLLTTDGTSEWRMGLWSDTTGWPTCGALFEDRLWLNGGFDYPTYFVGSKTGNYLDMQQQDQFGVVLDDGAIVLQLSSRKVSAITWMSTDEKGLLIGTGSGEWVVSAPDSAQGLSARNVRGRNSTARGSANVEPVKVDRQVLYIQRSRRTVREFAYVYEVDGYKSQSMSLFASHLGVAGFQEMDYAAEPFSIIWLRRDDGTIVGLTYNRDENVVGWHEQNVAGTDAFVERSAVIPSLNGEGDTLWLLVRRTINGETKRYIEFLTRFWDFDSTLDEAHFVDSGLRYTGAATDTVYGLRHLEGETVYGLADGQPFEAVVTDGAITLNTAAENVVVGLGYESYAETSRIEAGAADGTAQGKIKRIHSVVALMWDSAFGEVGRYEEGSDTLAYAEIDADRVFDELSDVTLATYMSNEIPLPAGYDRRGSIVFRQRADRPYPLNIVALMPRMVTQDGG